MRDLRLLLGLPQVYRLFVRAVGQRRELYIDEYVQPRAGQRILDIGCGPGDVLEYLPDGVEYLGVDHNQGYIEAARKRFGHRGLFLCQDANAVAISEPHSFDIVMANGLLHHLNDEQAGNLLSIASRALKPGGRLCTYDGCYLPRQSPLIKLLLSMDRGKFVRNKEQYEHLASRHFSSVAAHIRHDLQSIPYTILIMVCCGEGAGSDRAQLAGAGMVAS